MKSLVKMDNLFSEYITKDNIPSDGGNDQINLFNDLPSGNEKKKIKAEKTKNSSGYKSKEQKDLEKRAANSLLVKALQGEILNDMRIQSEKIDYYVKAKSVAELKFMDSLYFSYMERSHLEMIRMVKKIKPEIRILIYQEDKENIVNDIISCLLKEIKNALAGIKIAQINELKKWKQSV